MYSRKGEVFDMNKDRYMEALTHGVYLLGVKDGEKINFMTAAWAAQVSSNPKKLIVAVGRTHYTAEMIRRTGAFSVNVLPEGQEELAKKCGFASGKNTDKSEGMDYSLINGLPVVKDTAAYLLCHLVRGVEEGDHVLFIGEVTAGERSEKKPLIYDASVYFG